MAPPVSRCLHGRSVDGQTQVDDREFMKAAARWVGLAGRRPTARSTTSRPPHARAQGDEKLVQLLELLGHPTLHSRNRVIESFL
jgi:hypothetical protein